MSEQAPQSNSNRTYFMRSRGKVFGPFGLSQLQTLRRRGQLSRIHEVSLDRVTWQSAGDLPELFEAGGTTEIAKLSPALSRELPLTQISLANPQLPDNGPEWFYSSHGLQLGPIQQQQLMELIASGEVSTDDLVWSKGMVDWAPAGDVPHLQPLQPRKKKRRAQKRPKPSENIQYELSANHAFCTACGSPIHIKAHACPKCGVEQRREQVKNRITTAVLALCLGGIGVHRFYLGQPFLGLFYLFFFWTLIPVIVSFIEAIIFFLMSDETFDRTYN